MVYLFLTGQGMLGNFTGLRGLCLWIFSLRISQISNDESAGPRFQLPSLMVDKNIDR